MKVHSFESLAARDGEGLRYGIFLSGCPLRCSYCHNPDTWDKNNGTDYTPEALLRKIQRYTSYFAAGNGGVTFSGGEPLLQAGEIAVLGRLLKEAGIGYAIDTSGCVELTDAVKEAVSLADLVICDLKFYDEKSFAEHCKGDLKKVFAFLDYLRSIGKRLWLRTVIVPGLNDKEEDIRGYAAAASPYRDIIERYELLPFHTMGFFKYENLGIENPLKDVVAMERDRLTGLQQLLDSLQTEN